MRLLNTNNSTSSGRLITRLGLVMLAIICLAGGGMASYYLAVEPLGDALRSRNWQYVPARILDVELGGGPGAGNPGAKVLVTYRYQVAGQSYEGHRFGLHDWIDNAEAQKSAYGDLLYARNIRAWVNPDNPQEAVLNRELHWSVLVMAIPALTIAAVGFIILRAALIGTLATWRASRRLKRPGIK